MRFLRTIAFAAAILITAHAQALRIDLVPNTAIVTVPGTTSLNIVLSELDAAGQVVSAYDLSFLYDALLVNAIGVTFGGALGGAGDSVFGSDLTVPGAVQVFEVSLLSDTDLDALQGDSVLLASLTFRGLSPGISSLSFDDPLFLVGRDGVPLADVSVGGARIIVQPGTVPEPATSVLLLLGLAAAALFSRSRSRRHGAAR